jgi:Tol biopolymer transport system component
VLDLRGETAAGREWAARLAGDIDTIVEKALAVDPAGRYSSVEALGADLARHLAGDPVLARPASFAYRLAKFARRHRAGVTASALVVASLAIGGGIALWQARVAARERARPLPAVRFLTYSGHDSMPAASPDGRAVAFRSLRDGRSRIWIASLATGDERPLTDGDDRHPRFSPDGSELLFSRAADETSALLAVPSSGGRPRELFADALAGDYSPDGTRIAFVRQRPGEGDVESIVMMGTSSGGEARELARLGGRALHPPRWSPDGRAIAVTASSLGVGERASVALVDTASGTVRRLALDGSSPRGLAWVGAERLVVARPDDVTGWITGGSSRLLLHDVAIGAARTVLASATSIASFDRVGAGRLVFTSGSFRVNLREIALDAGAPAGRWLTRGDASDRQPAFSPDGREAVFSSNRGGNLDLWIVTLATGAARRVTHDPALDWDPAFTADGDLLWSTNRSGTFEIWRAASDGTNARQITRDGAGAENPGATPDGSWIVYSSRAPQRRGIVRARPDGSGVALIAGGELFLPELSPDGRLVAYLDLGGERPVLRIAELATGRPRTFALPLRPSDPGDDPDAGRCRWFPDGRSLAVLERDADGSSVVTRRFLDGSSGEAVRIAAEPGHAAESFGIAPGGDRLVVAFWETTTNLMLADNVPGIGP